MAPNRRIRAPGLVLPGEYSEGGVVRVRGRPAPLGVDPAVLQGLVGAGAALLVQASPPSFLDQLGSYCTHQEILAQLISPDVLGLSKDATTEDVVAIARRLPFEPSMWVLSALHKALQRDRTGVDWQIAMVLSMYGSGVIANAIAGLIRHQGRVFFTEQQLFALMRLLVLYADDRSEVTPQDKVDLSAALLLVPGTVLQAANEDYRHETPEPPNEEMWMHYFIANGGLANHISLAYEMSRVHRMYEVIAKSSAARRRVEFCPLDDWLTDRYGLSVTGLQAFGFSIFAGSQMANEDETPLGVLPTYYAATQLADRVDRPFDAIAADRAWFREQFARTEHSPRHAAFQIYPFLMRPCLRRSDGSALVLSPRGIANWLGSSGMYYRLLDLTRENGQFDTFSHFNGWITERYARHLVHVAHPKVSSAVVITRVIPEVTYPVGKQEMKSNDVTVDLGLDLVLFEVTAKRLTAKSIVDAEIQSIQDDLRRMIIEKMEQLGRVIRHIRDGLIPGIDMKFVTNIWPVIVSSEGAFLNPSLTSYVQREGGHHLDFTIPGVTIKQVVIMDLEELEILMGIVQETGRLTDVLEKLNEPAWASRGLKAWHHGDELSRIGTGENRFLRQESRRIVRAWKPIFGFVAQPPSTEPDDSAVAA